MRTNKLIHSIFCLLVMFGAASCGSDIAGDTAGKEVEASEPGKAGTVSMTMRKMPSGTNEYSFNTYGIDCSTGKQFLESQAYQYESGDSDNYYCNFTYYNDYGNRDAIVYVSNTNTISFGDFSTSSGFGSVTTTSSDWSKPEYVGIQGANISTFITNGETLNFVARPLSYSCRLKISLDNYDKSKGDLFVVTGLSVCAPKATYNLPTPSECAADAVYAGNSSEGYSMVNLIASTYGWPNVLTNIYDYSLGSDVWSDIKSNKYVSTSTEDYFLYSSAYWFYPPLMHGSKSTYSKMTIRLYLYAKKKGSEVLGSIETASSGTESYVGEAYDITVPTEKMRTNHYFGGTTTYTLAFDFGSTSARPYGVKQTASDILPATITVTNDD